MQIRSRIFGCKVKHNFLFINGFSQLFLSAIFAISRISCRRDAILWRLGAHYAAWALFRWAMRCFTAL